MLEKPEFQPPRECPLCLKPLAQSYGCRGDRSIKFADEVVCDPVPYGEEEEYQSFDSQPIEACEVCGAMPGRLHHPGCSNEECPECGDNYKICSCTTDEKLRISNDWMTQERTRRSRR